MVLFLLLFLCSAVSLWHIARHCALGLSSWARTWFLEIGYHSMVTSLFSHGIFMTLGLVWKENLSHHISWMGEVVLGRKEILPQTLGSCWMGERHELLINKIWQNERKQPWEGPGSWKFIYPAAEGSGQIPLSVLKPWSLCPQLALGTAPGKGQSSQE